MDKSKGILYLIPSTLGEYSPMQVIPVPVLEKLNDIEEFIVEDERSARRFLKAAGIKRPLQEIILHPLNKHTDTAVIPGYLKVIKEGKNVGIISEAGCPAVADPGAEVVKLAQQLNIRVVPLTGPSSIILALMGSGMNGQSFAFHGYLPIEKSDRTKKLKELERISAQFNQTQIFIETPFRNNKLIEDILSSCKPDTLLCLAVDLTLGSEYIRTKPVSEWKKNKPDFHKRPAVFLILGR